MKNLSKYAVKCGSETEAKIALRFYQLATHKPISPTSYFYPNVNNYVGVCDERDTYAKKAVTCGSLSYDETPIGFEDMWILADSPSRVLAYNKAMNGLIKQTEAKKKSEKAKAKKVEEKPASVLTVTFYYPGSRTGWLEFRTVKVSQMDDTYIQGYEEEGGKFKKYLRSKMNRFTVVSYGK
jgi:hypothetical protein